MIAENIKRLRKLKGVTQRALSTKSGIAEITIRNYEAGKYKPKMDNLLKIANALGTTASEISGETLHELVLPAWIPCSERMPQESCRYLVTIYDGVNMRVTVAPYHPRTESWTLTGRMAYYRPLAWMPLPEPYKEENNDNSRETKQCR